MSASPVIEINSGKLRGIVENSVSGVSYVAFKGIPFAEPPIGNLRFRKPVPAKPWRGIKDASKYSDMCCQFDEEQGKCRGSEDCLYLNVFVPVIEPAKLKPVLVWIHGGAFHSGSGDDDEFGADYFMMHDIVLVTINYRLGCLGFLDLQDAQTVGNYGLWDQILALQWVKQNISAFGGDSNNITIFGMSAGAISIHCLTLSTAAEGLFHKAIMMSGSATMTLMKNPLSPKQAAFKLAKLLGSDITDPQKLVEYLRTVDVNQLITVQQQVLSPQEKCVYLIPFGPTDDSSGSDSIFSKSIEDEAQKGIQVPCIISNTSREALGFADVAKIGEDIGGYIHPGFLEKLSKINISADDVFKYYVGGRKLTSENIPGYVDLYSDSLKCSIHEMLEIQAKKSNTPTYYYEFTFDSRKTLAKNRLNNTLPGAAHVDDLGFMFHHKALEKLGLEPLYLDQLHKLMIQRMTTLLVNFARTGNPTPEKSDLIPVIWEPIDNPDYYKCLKIDNPLVIGVNKNYYRDFSEKIASSKSK